ncbi:unnamed protein product [Diatraea saccharalis]|uniref:FK506-binding protein n=1 Tax=Diatraea saccharalis TaxID=40085 RepID=A0A9N9WGM8_9NEOP|nr:unnamed protein product [Diatraea saccharalis]
MFWGLIMEPNKRYTQVVEKPFHISQAAMDISTGDNDPCQVMVVVDGKNFLVCTLQKNKTIQVPLDLYFKAGDSIAFLTNGKCNVHLTGYLDPEFEEEVSDEEDSQEEEEEEAPALVPAKNKRKLENTNNATAKKAKKEKSDKKKATEDSSDSDDDEDGKDQLQKFLDGEDIDTDENDDSFNVNTSADASDSDEEESDDDEAEEEEEDDEDKSDQADTTLDTSQEEAMPDMSKLSKAQRRRLKKKLQKQQEKSPKQQEKSPKQVNGVDKAKKDKPEQKAEKKKPEAKKEAQDGHTEKKEKKSLSGGVFIEDLKVGNGPVAKPGKVVMVYYEGRLKQNNKMFDNCLKGPGFKFKLGAKEVISGWDVGVSGMKVGGKRKIICPPAMAYGAKGSPPVIPPNSTLVFEVELKNVK